MSEFRTRRSARGGVDLVVHLDPAETAVLGADADMLARYLVDVLAALVGLRTGEWAADSDVGTAGAYDAVVAVTRLNPRLRGVLDAAVRAHQAAGGSVRHLQAAMDAPHPSGAQYARGRLPAQPGVWETWATSGGPQHPARPLDRHEREDTR